MSMHRTGPSETFEKKGKRLHKTAPWAAAIRDINLEREIEQYIQITRVAGPQDCSCCLGGHPAE